MALLTDNSRLKPRRWGTDTAAKSSMKSICYYEAEAAAAEPGRALLRIAAGSGSSWDSLVVILAVRPKGAGALIAVTIRAAPRRADVIATKAPNSILGAVPADGETGSEPHRRRVDASPAAA